MPAKKLKLTKAQRAALVEAAGPRKQWPGTGVSVGGGKLMADTRVERALIRMGLAEGDSRYPFQGSSVWITDAGKAEVAKGD